MIHKTAQSSFELNEKDVPFPDLQQNRLALTNNLIRVLVS